MHESQRSAARALGLTQWQALRFAVLPQAVRNVIPAAAQRLVSLQKDVALVSVIGIREAVREAQIYTARTFNYTLLHGRRRPLPRRQHPAGPVHRLVHRPRPPPPDCRPCA